MDKNTKEFFKHAGHKISKIGGKVTSMGGNIINAYRDRVNVENLRGQAFDEDRAEVLRKRKIREFEQNQ